MRPRPCLLLFAPGLLCAQDTQALFVGDWAHRIQAPKKWMKVGAEGDLPELRFVPEGAPANDLRVLSLRVLPPPEGSVKDQALQDLGAEAGGRVVQLEDRKGPKGLGQALVFQREVPAQGEGEEQEPGFVEWRAYVATRGGTACFGLRAKDEASLRALKGLLDDLIRSYALIGDGPLPL